jgi:hypothetical protein
MTDKASSFAVCLNPRFVEMLMGFPLGWTDCEPSVGQWSRFKQRWRSAFWSAISAMR